MDEYGRIWTSPGPFTFYQYTTMSRWGRAKIGKITSELNVVPICRCSCWSSCWSRQSNLTWCAQRTFAKPRSQKAKWLQRCQIVTGVDIPTGRGQVSRQKPAGMPATNVLNAGVKYAHVNRGLRPWSTLWGSWRRYPGPERCHPVFTAAVANSGTRRFLYCDQRARYWPVSWARLVRSLSHAQLGILCLRIRNTLC
jgi:hypothetical protein